MTPHKSKSIIITTALLFALGGGLLPVWGYEISLDQAASQTGKSAVAVTPKAGSENAAGAQRSFLPPDYGPESKARRGSTTMTQKIIANDSPIPQSFTLETPAHRAHYDEIVKMQAKLTDVLELTAALDKINRAKIGEVQNLVEKARVNQVTLNKLAAPSDLTSGIRKSDAEQILLNKKIRAMREEAEKQIAHSNQP